MLGARAVLYLALVLVLVAVLSTPVRSNPDPCLVVYPDAPCIYHYDVTEYYTVGPGDSLYDPEYDRGGEVLLERGTNEVDLSIYQAPGLLGFEPSSGGEEGYFFPDREFDLVIDGFSHIPTIYENVLVIFDQIEPSGCTPDIVVNGDTLSGNVYPAGDLVVSTPTPHGNNYSDVMVLPVSWSGCYGMHIWAFADENYDGEHEGKECFTAFSHDIFVPIQGVSWGTLKAMYK